MVKLRRFVLPVLAGFLVAGLAVAEAKKPKTPPGPDPAAKVKAELAIKDGDAWFQLGDMKRAQTSYEEALGKDPGASIAKVRMAMIAWRGGDGNRAIALLTEVEASGAQQPDAWSLMGEIRLARKEYGESAQYYARYVKAVPKDLWAALALARALKGMAAAGDAAAKGTAAELLKQLALSPDKSLAGEAEEELYTLLYGEAGKQFRQAKLALLDGQATRAIDMLKEVLKAQPQLEEAYYLMGLAYLDPSVNKRVEAKTALGKAPNVKEAQLKLGVAMFEDANGEPDLKKAEAVLRKAINLYSEYQEAYFYLGQVLDALADPKGAAEAYRMAVNIDSSSDVGKLASSKYTVLTGNVTSGAGPQIGEGDAIDAAKEIQMAQQLEDVLGSQGLIINDQKQLQARFDGMLEKLVAVAEVKELEPRILIVKSDEINAVTVPGGRIFIYQGLIDFIKRTAGDKDEVYAAVIAHELAHAALRHVPSGLRAASAAAQSRGDVRVELSRMATTLTRVHEYEADHYGALYLTRAGMATQGMITLFEAMKKEMGDGPTNSTHPTKTERIARIKELLLDVRSKSNRLAMGDKELGAGNYLAAIRHYEVFLGVFPSSEPAHERSGIAYHRMAIAPRGFLGIWKRGVDVPPKTPVTFAVMSKARMDQMGGKIDPKIEARWLKRAMMEYRAALARDPMGGGTARAALGAALLDMADMKEARRVLEEGVKMQRVNLEMAQESGGKPDANSAKLMWQLGILENGLAVAMATNGDWTGAHNYFAAAAKHAPALDQTWYNLASMEQMSGKFADGVKAIDSYLAVDKDAKSLWAAQARARQAEMKKALLPVPKGVKPGAVKPPAGAKAVTPAKPSK